MKKNEIISILAHYLADNTFESRFILPVLREFTEDTAGAVTLDELITTLEKEKSDSIERLLRYLKDIRHKEVLKYHLKRKGGTAQRKKSEFIIGDLPLDAPLGWEKRDAAFRALKRALSFFKDLCFAKKVLKKAVSSVDTALDTLNVSQTITQEFKQAVKEVNGRPDPWGYFIPDRLIDRKLASEDEPDVLSAEDLESLKKELENSRHEASAHVDKVIDDLPDNLPSGLDEAATLELIADVYKRTKKQNKKRKLLDMVCAWPTDQAIPFIMDNVQEPWEEERAALILSLRFGTQGTGGWTSWKRWCDEQEKRLDILRAQIENIHNAWPGSLLLVWYLGRKEKKPDIVRKLTALCMKDAPAVKPERFGIRWESVISQDEWRSIWNKAEPSAEPLELEKELKLKPDEKKPEKKEGVPVKAELPAEPEEKESEPQVPSIWQDHIKPFFTSNWYMVAGIIMVIVGSSLLAYYTWDKHWLLRYTIMPALLGGFTVALALTGSWIEKREKRFIGTAAMLRGAAIGLLPINFMAVALMAQDPQVTVKTFAVPLMGILYIGLFGWGLNRWCAAIHDSFKWILACTLLFLNTLVVLGPLAHSLGSLKNTYIMLVLGAGFYMGFAAIGGVVIHFSKKVLSRKLADEKIVPWFLGATLVVTYLQVFAWVHGYMRQLPEVYTYAPLVILAGWLILFVERRTLELRQKASMHGAESFLGFACILLGMFMGMGNPYFRIVCFVMAGTVWILQTLYRHHVYHCWIGLVLAAMGGASVGFLEQFPGSWYPAIGVGVGLIMGGVGWIGKKLKFEELEDAGNGMQIAVFVITTAVAMLTQWHYQSPPFATAGCLLFIAGVLGWRAYKDKNLRLVHMCAVMLALILPYIGCVDIKGRTLHGNTMVFGLAVLSLVWLGLNWIIKHPLIRGARSTVLWMYGSLAVAGMILRVLIEKGRPADVMWFYPFMDYAGPIMITIVLALATYFSRSLVPAAMAIVISVILFPELKVYFKETFERFGFGTGLGSSCSAFIIVLASFYLRKSSFLKDLKEGDMFMGYRPFPLARLDHTLFTWPLLVSSLFLTVKVETWNFIRNMLDDGIGLKTSAALCISGVTWALLGVYYRTKPFARAGTHLGWIWVLIGIFFGYGHLADDPHWSIPFLISGALFQTVFLVSRYVLERNHAWIRNLISEPLKTVLKCGSFILAIVSVIYLAAGGDVKQNILLIIFLAVQLIWHGLNTESLAYGTMLFIVGLCALLAWTVPGNDFLFREITVARSLTPVLLMIAIIHVLLFALEFRQDLYRKIKQFMVPFHTGISLIALTVGIGGIAGMMATDAYSLFQQIFLLILILNTARSNGSGPFVFLGIVHGFMLVHFSILQDTGDLPARFELLSTPWRFGLLALIMSVSGCIGGIIHSINSRILSSPFRLKFLKFPAKPWLFIPAVALAWIGVIYHTIDPILRESPLQLLAPYFSAVALGIIAYIYTHIGMYAMTVIMLALGNIHSVRIVLGDLLRPQGVSEVHLVCLGLGITLIITSLFRMLLRKKKELTVFLSRAGLGLAGMVLILLSANYFVHPNIDKIVPLRFVISGVMAALAAFHFRWAARHPGPGEEDSVGLCEGLYHFGLTFALWCAALLIPWFRKPVTALFALGLPVIYFYLRAEIGLAYGLERAKRYRTSAATLGFIILALYVFRGVFQMVMFPDVPVHTNYYHYNAPFVILISLIMLRLHGLGGTEWLAFYGGLGIIGSTYFTLTAFPKLRPFDYPVGGAWCAVILSHFWTAVSYRRSPVRTCIMHIAGLNTEIWNKLRRSWGMWLMISTQGAVLWGILDYQDNTYMVAPLILGAASILIHHGIIRKSPWYFIAGASEIMLALHMDFLIPSYLHKDCIVWVLIGIWALLILVYDLTYRWKTIPQIGTASALLAVGVMMHVIFHHHPCSAVGLWAVATGALIAAFVPCQKRSAQTYQGFFPAAFLLWIPSWLVYFSQVPLLETAWIDAVTRAWPVLLTACAVFLTGISARLFQEKIFNTYNKLPRLRPRLFDQTLSWLGVSGHSINTTVLWCVLITTGLIQILHYGKPFEPRAFILVILLFGSLATAWYYEALFRKSLLEYIIIQVCVFGLFAAVRRYLMLTTDFWTYEFDVWASLAISFCLTGTKQFFDLKPREIRTPLMGTLCLLPVFAVSWVLIHNMGPNVAMLVVGLNSLMFAYMGKDERESPHNIIAVGGFVAFILIGFWSKFELRVIHAYVIPVGAGILVLLQLFRERITNQVRNGVRLVTLLAMLGSTGYYALIDDRYPVVFNLTMIVICLLAMGLGSFLRIRLYVAAAFTALIVDLASIVYKVLHHMDRSARMTAVGSIVLLIGALLVFGAIYYKTHQEEISNQVSSLRKKFGEWE